MDAPLPKSLLSPSLTVQYLTDQKQFFYVLVGSDDDNGDGNLNFHLYLKLQLIDYRFDPRHCQLCLYYYWPEPH